MKTRPNQSVVPLHTPLFRGGRRLRIALVGMPNAGKSTLFNAVSSASPLFLLIAALWHFRATRMDPISGGSPLTGR